MTEETDEVSTLDRIIEGASNLSLGKISDEVERRVRRRVKKASRRIAYTITGLFLFMMAVAFISVSIARGLSTILDPALSWGLVGLILALLGTILVLMGRLIA